MPEAVTRLCQYTSLLVSHLILLPWCTSITGYWISSNKNNSQQQPTIGYTQTSKSIPGMSQLTRNNHNWNICITILLCQLPQLSCVLICGVLLAFTAASRQKKHHVIHHMEFVLIHWNCTYTVSYTIC